MAEFDSEEDIRQFIVSNGLDKDFLEERSESFEAQELRWEGLAKGFAQYLEDRVSAMERRLDMLEGERLRIKRSESVDTKISGRNEWP